MCQQAWHGRQEELFCSLLQQGLACTRYRCHLFRWGQKLCVICQLYIFAGSMTSATRLGPCSAP
jgi:hypothetical protein